MRADQILCINAVEGMRALPFDSIPMTLTSPPYDGLRDFGGHLWDFKTFRSIAEELWRVTMPGGVVVWIVADQIKKKSYSGTCFRQALYFMEIGFHMHNELIMDKVGSRSPSNVRYGGSLEHAFVLSKGTPRTVNLIRDKPNKHAGESRRVKRRGVDGRLQPPEKSRPIALLGYRSAIWQYPVGAGLTTKDMYAFEHPALMPEKMAKEHILSWSRPGDLVFDPMCGAGTTCKMALLNDRRYLGFEVHEPYHRIALRRMHDAHAENRRRLDEWLWRSPQRLAKVDNGISLTDAG